MLKGLKFLVRICTDLGFNNEALEYANQLKKTEKVRKKDRIFGKIEKKKRLINWWFFFI